MGMLRLNAYEASKWIFRVGNGICVSLKMRAMICVSEINFGVDGT